MPYTRLWISNEEAEILMEWSKDQERYNARSTGNTPKRVTLKSAARACFVEGLADLEARASDFRDEDSDDEAEATDQ